MTNATSTTQPPLPPPERRGRRLRAWHIIVPILLLVSILFAVAVFMMPVWHERAVLKTVVEQRKAHENPTPEKRQAKIDLLYKMGVITATSPEQYIKIDGCIVSSYGDLFIKGFYQRCGFSYIDLFTTDLSIEQVKTKIYDDAAVYEQLGGLVGFSSHYCPQLRSVNGPFVGYYYPEKVTFKNIGGDIASQGWCALPDEVAKEVPTTNYRVLHTFSLNDLRHAKPYIVVGSFDEYYYEELGCKVGLLCHSPRNSPITGF